MCESGHYDFTGTDMRDRIGHGQSVTDIISESVSSKMCIAEFKYTDKRDTCDNTCTKKFNIALLEHIKKVKPIAINMSYSGVAPSKEELQVLLYAISHKIHLFIAAGNDGISDCFIFPACYNLKSKYFHVITTRDIKANKFDFAEIIEPDNLYEKRLISYGTSFATAIALKRWIKK